MFALYAHNNTSEVIADLVLLVNKHKIAQGYAEQCFRDDIDIAIEELNERYSDITEKQNKLIMDSISYLYA